MALEPGGYADKLGNRYEGRWVVRQMLRVLNEDLQSITLEAVGDAGFGVDLWVKFPDGTLQAQQCKIRNSSIDRWSLAELNNRGILSAMKAHFQRDPSCQFKLVTPIPFVLLHDICESARNSKGDPEEFFFSQIEAIGEDRRGAFRQFCRYLELDHDLAAGRAAAYGFLRRLFIENWPDSSTSQMDLKDIAQVLVTGDPATTVALLADWASDMLRKPIDSSAIWEFLEAQGCHPRRLPSDTRILQSIKSLQDQFFESLECGLIAGELLPREETAQVIDALRDRGIVIVHGHPGVGKSGVLHELTQKLRQEGIAYLPLRLDRQTPEKTPRQFGIDIGLPESPVLCIDAIANSRPAVLILDQLDAVRWTSRHSLNALEVCRSIVREIQTLQRQGKPIGVVLACRTYDLQNDPDIQSWIKAEKDRKGGLAVLEVPVKPLAPEVVNSVVGQFTASSYRLPARQLAVLQNPQHLAMWVQIVKSLGVVDFQNRVQLMQEYWKTRMRELHRLGHGTSDVEETLHALVSYMENHDRVSAPQGVLSNEAIRDSLLHVGLIQESQGQITFSHQSYLDYQIARRVVRTIYNNGGNIAQWLGSKDLQSLFLREQLRQALCLLSIEAPPQFLDSVKEVLSSPNIRFHLKHLCLEVAGDLDAPTEGLHEYLDGLAVDTQWAEHVIGTVYLDRVPYIQWLIENGTIASWLADTKRRELALRILRNSPKELADSVTNVLLPYFDHGEEWRQQILSCLSWHVNDDSGSMFNLRVKLAQQGTFYEYVNWRDTEAKRAWQLFDAVLSTQKTEDFQQNSLRSNRNSRFEAWAPEDIEVLLDAIRANPLDSWTSLTRHISRLMPQEAANERVFELWLDGNRYGMKHSPESVPHLLATLCIEAGKCLAATEGQSFWDVTHELRANPSRVFRYLLVEVYSSLPAKLSDDILLWLLSDLDILCVGTGVYEPEWTPASRLIEAMSPHCSYSVFSKLEQAIVSYHSPTELRKAQFWLSSWRRGHYGDYWGRAQYFLLPSLCSTRCRSETIGLIGVLKHKFSSYADSDFIRSANSKFGSVTSTLPAGSLEGISDRAWLAIIQNERIPQERAVPRIFKVDSWRESSVSQFSGQLRDIAKRYPERFARLALSFPPGTAASYKAAILDALKVKGPESVPEAEVAGWRPAPIEAIDNVLTAFGIDDDDNYALQFCWLMHERAEVLWSNSTLQKLIDYASHANPAPEQLNIWQSGRSSRSDDATIESLENNAINCVRGIAAAAIGQQLWSRPELFDLFRPTIEHLCSDPHPAVLVASTRMCLPLLNIDRDFAIKCLLAAVARDLRAAGSRNAVPFFNCGAVSHYEQLAPVVRQMLNCNLPELAQQGATEATARWIFHEYYESEVKQCLAGSTPQRTGAAKAAAYLISNPAYFDKCKSIIEVVMDDDEEDVRHELGRLAHSADILSSSSGKELLQRLVHSKTFTDSPDLLQNLLSEYSGSLLQVADVLLAIGEQYVGPLKDAAQDPRQRTMHNVSDFIPLLLRLYEQADSASDKEILKKCLDCLDSLFEHRVGVRRETIRAIG